MGRDDRSHISWSGQRAERSMRGIAFLTFGVTAKLSQRLSRCRPICLRNRGFILGARQRRLLDRAYARLVATLRSIFTFCCTGGSSDRRRAVGGNSHDGGKRVGLAVAEEVVTPG